MKKTFNLLLILLGLFIIFGCDEDNPIPEEVNTVNILTINDSHGSFVTDEYPGMDKVSAAINSLEATYGRFIKIANGDIFQGSYVSNVNYGKPMLEALNLLGFHAFVLGNHEFDWGLDKIAAYKDGDPDNGEADFPFLAANIVYKETGERLPWTEDYVVVENNGYRVGIIGLIGSNLENSIASDMVADYEFLDSKPIVQELSLKLRDEEDCDVVVVATHNYYDFEIRSFVRLPEESRVDAIICGHSHQKVSDSRMRSDGYQVPVIQCDDKNETVGAIVIEMSEDKTPVKANVLHKEPGDYYQDKKLSDLIKKYSRDIEEGNRAIGYTTEFLSEGRVGRETVKALCEKYGVDVAFINTGGVRESLKTGIIKVKDIYEVYPFNNRVIVTAISGVELTRLISAQASFLYSYPNLSSLVVESEKTYRVATIDYVFTGSYYQSYFRNSPRDDKDLLRDVFIEYIAEFYKD